MPKANRMTRKNARKVLMATADMIEKDKDRGKELVAELNKMLDGLLNDDFFGTEGQCDPRGDWRDVV